MAKYNAIAQVSNALIELLQTAMTGREDVISLDRNEIVLSSPDNVGSNADTRLSLYLYNIERSKHQEAATITESNTRQAPSLALNLHYLLTAYPTTSGANETTNMQDQHNAPGLAMQVLHDNSVLTDEHLDKSFETDTHMTISMNADSEGSVSRIWNSFQNVPRYPSVTYEVGPVRIDSRREEPVHRVREKTVKSEQKDI